METTKSICRMAVLFATFGLGFIMLMAVPTDDTKWWFESLLGSKIISLAAFLVFANLYNRWKKTDKWVAAYDRMNDESKMD